MKRSVSSLVRGIGLLCAVLACAARAEETKPNIVLIFVDDMGYTDLGIHGFDPDVLTPNLDRLARDGVLFTDGYVTAPQCVPSRAALLTGRHQNAFGMDDNHKGPLPLSEATIADRLQAVGYATGMVGKWHLNPVPNSSHHEWDGVSTVPYLPRNRGFEDYWFGSLNNYEVNYLLDGSDHPGAPASVTDTRLRVDVQTEAALAFLERRTSDARPFFLYLAWFAPHAPLATQGQLENGINGQNYWGQMAHVGETKRRQGLAIIKAVDYGLGLVRGKLDEMGVADNTLIFFISDNGAPLRPTAYIGSHNQPLVGEKGMETDGGQRVPYIAAWPGTIATNQVLSQMVSALDASATVLAVAHATNNTEGVEGRNLMPWMLGEETGPVHETLYWRWRTQCAIRKGDWKFVRLGDQYRWLFDMAGIGKETAADCKLAEYPQLAADLEAELLDYANANWHFKGLPTDINSQDLQFYVDHVDPLLAASFFTWAGGAATPDWGAAANWSGGETPSFNNNAVLVWPASATGHRVGTLGSADRTARALLFTSPMEQDATIRLQEGLSGGPARTLRMEAASGNAAIEIGDEVLGDVVFDGAGTLRLQSDLDVVQHGDATLTFDCGISGPGNLALAGAGPVRFDGANTFTGTLTVGSAGRIGGGGSLAGSLVLQDGARVEFDAGKTLTVNGAAVDLGNLATGRIAGLDETVAPGTYTLIGGPAAFDFSRAGDVGFENRVAIGGGRTAYLRPGSLQVVVQPGADRLVSLHAAAQQPGTKQVRIEYTGYSASSGTATVSLAVADPLGGPVSATSLSGDIGAGVEIGEDKTITWNAGADWDGQVGELAITLTLDDGTAPVGDTVSAAVDTRDYVLEVISPYGTPDPAVGTHTNAWGTTLAATVASPDGGFYCEGWIGSGIQPSAGGGLSTGSITLAEPEATLTWLWMEDAGQAVWTGGADDGTAANAQWNVAGNWLTGSVPPWGDTADLVFHTRTAGNRTSYLGAEATIRSLTFNGHVGEAISILLENHAGEKRTLAFSSDSGTARLAVDGDAAAGITLSGGTSIALASDLEIAHNGTGWLTLGGSGCKLAGAGNMVLAGGGRVRIADGGGQTGNTGSTTVNGGILSVQLQRALNGILNTETSHVTVKTGAAVVVENGWTDDQFGFLLSRPGTIFEDGARAGFNTAAGNRTYDVAIADTASGALGLAKVGDNTLALGGASTYTGGSHLLDGTVSISAAANLGAVAGGLALDGGALRVTTAGNLNLLAGRTTTVLQRGGALEIADPAGNLQVTGPLAGSGMLVVKGPGRVTPSNTGNTFAGGWVVRDGGLVSVASASATDARLAGVSVAFDNGSLLFSGSGSQSLNRATVVESGGGTFVLGNDSAQNPTITWNGAISGAGALTVANRGGTSGKLVLAGENTYRGNTTIHAGAALALADGGSLAFHIGANGVNNRIAGAGAVELDGTLVFDLDVAGTTPGDAWTVVDAAGAAYGTTFSVAEFNHQGGGIWTKEIGGNRRYEFDQGTGVLEVKGPAVPEAFRITGLHLAPLGGQMVISVEFDSAGHLYGLQFRTNLLAGAGWSNLAAGAQSPLRVTNDWPGAFFRVGAE